MAAVSAGPDIARQLNCMLSSLPNNNLSLNLSGYCVDDKLSRDLFKNRLTEAVELSDLLDQIIASIGPREMPMAFARASCAVHDEQANGAIIVAHSQPGVSEIVRADQSGNGIARLTLTENAVSVTTRHSASAPSASEAATASISRGEATVAPWLLKPEAPGDRFMVEHPYQHAGESPA